MGRTASLDPVDGITARISRSLVKQSIDAAEAACACACVVRMQKKQRSTPTTTWHQQSRMRPCPSRLGEGISKPPIMSSVGVHLTMHHDRIERRIDAGFEIDGCERSWSHHPCINRFASSPSCVRHQHNRETSTRVHTSTHAHQLPAPHK